MVPTKLLDLGVGRLADAVLQLRVVIAGGVQRGREGFRVGNLVQEPNTPDENLDVVLALVGEVPGKAVSVLCVCAHKTRMRFGKRTWGQELEDRQGYSNAVSKRHDSSA